MKVTKISLLLVAWLALSSMTMKACDTKVGA